MRYFVTLSGKEHAVDVKPLTSGGFDVIHDGKTVEADVVQIGGSLSMILDGQVLDLTVEGKPPAIGVIARGKRTYLTVESERMRAAHAAKSKGPKEGDGLLVSPMPGRVLKVLVAKGDEVTVGQALVVVEAMKMENELRATKAGVLGDCWVAAGDTVAAGQKLVRVG